jgi:hypothetical protein
MKGMIFKKALLLSGIFLLSTFILAQLSWGCDDDDKDKWDCDRHDKWDCHKHGEPCQPPKIQRVFLEYQADSIVFEIWGKNFDHGALPAVTLGGIYDLTVDGYDDNEITATLPIKDKNFAYGDYRLVVSTCNDSACKDKYCKDHGPNCKCKYCKDHCSKCKDNYCKDNQYKCRCKDRYSLTIGAAGQQIGLEIVTQTVTIDFLETPEAKPELKAICPSGYKVTGGGFSQKLMEIKESKPLKDENAWQVIGEFTTGRGEAYELTVHAVCAKIK